MSVKRVRPTGAVLSGPATRPLYETRETTARSDSACNWQMPLTRRTDPRSRTCLEQASDVPPPRDRCMAQTMIIASVTALMRNLLVHAESITVPDPYRVSTAAEVRARLGKIAERIATGADKLD